MTTLRQCIKQRSVIDIDLSPTRDVIYSGICINDNGKVLILVNFDARRGTFDGYTVFRSKEISRFRPWTRTDRRAIRRNNFAEVLGHLDSSRMRNMRSSLLEASEKGLISFFTGVDEDSYYVGRLNSIRGGIANFKLVNPQGSWSRYKRIALERINYFSFATTYEKKLGKGLGSGLGALILSAPLYCSRNMLCRRPGFRRPHRPDPTCRFVTADDWWLCGGVSQARAL